MMETLEMRRELIFPLAWSNRGPRRLVPCAVTGPTCDSEDTLFLDVQLPEDLGPGDRLYIQTAGAYTTAYASRFNGFEVPRTQLVGESILVERARPLARPGPRALRTRASR
jgi:ornithine decarboxylase